jgi:hypothetical protein
VKCHITSDCRKNVGRKRQACWCCHTEKPAVRWNLAIRENKILDTVAKTHCIQSHRTKINLKKAVTWIFETKQKETTWNSGHVVINQLAKRIQKVLRKRPGATQNLFRFIGFAIFCWNTKRKSASQSAVMRQLLCLQTNTRSAWVFKWENSSNPLSIQCLFC